MPVSPTGRAVGRYRCGSSDEARSITASPLMASTTTSSDESWRFRHGAFQLAAILAAAVLLASMVSVQIGVSVALIELALGVLLGNTFKLDPNQSWLVFIAGFASVVLTFLAGAEVDPDDFRERLWPRSGSRWCRSRGRSWSRR